MLVAVDHQLEDQVCQGSSDRLGHCVAHLSKQGGQVAAERAGMRADLADAVLATQVNADRGPGGNVMRTVPELTGQPARTFDDRAHEHAPLFQTGDDHLG